MKKFFPTSVILTFCGFVTTSAFAKADIVCKDDNYTVVISEDRKTATLSGVGIDEPQSFAPLSELHGILTAPGFAFFVHNDYGCLRRAIVISSLRVFKGDSLDDSGYVGTAEFPLCSGGSTPDHICGVK
jgi:hypothetical protein